MKSGEDEVILIPWSITQYILYITVWRAVYTLVAHTLAIICTDLHRERTHLLSRMLTNGRK